MGHLWPKQNQPRCFAMADFAEQTKGVTGLEQIFPLTLLIQGERMGLTLNKVMFRNRAPFTSLDLQFSENEITILTAANGKGKTTILSHIADMFFELARRNYYNEFEDRSTAFYRVTKPLYNLKRDKPSIFYARFTLDKEEIDYIDICGPITSDQYHNIFHESKITFDNIDKSLKQNHNNIKLL